MAIAGASRKRKRKRKKRRGVAPVSPPQSQPAAPPPPPKYKHTLGWDDSAGDGLVREEYEWVDAPPTDTPPPRPLPKPQDPPAPKSAQSFGTYSGPFGRVQAKRLLDRAGFGPKPGQAVDLSQLGLQGAVYSLTRPSGSANLVGPAPVDGDGLPIAPIDAWGQDHCWWLDRMVRSDQQLVERMTFIWHDWFANSQREGQRPAADARPERAVPAHAAGQLPGPAHGRHRRPGDARVPRRDLQRPQQNRTRTTPAR